MLACAPLQKQAYNHVFNVGAEKPYTINQVRHAASDVVTTRILCCIALYAWGLDHLERARTGAPFACSHHHLTICLRLPRAVAQLATQISSQWNVGMPTSEQAKVVHLAARKEVQNAEASHQKMRCFFGDQEPVDLRIGLKRTVTWAKNFFSDVPTQKEFDAVEVMRSMPPSWRRPGMVEVPEVHHDGPDRSSYKPSVEELAQ